MLEVITTLAFPLSSLVIGYVIGKLFVQFLDCLDKTE